MFEGNTPERKDDKEPCVCARSTALGFWEEEDWNGEGALENVIYLHPADGSDRYDARRWKRFVVGRGWSPGAQGLIPKVQDFGRANLVTRTDEGKLRNLRKEGGSSGFAREVLRALAQFEQIGKLETETDRHPCMLGLKDGTVVDLTCGQVVTGDLAAELLVTKKAAALYFPGMDTRRMEKALELVIPDPIDRIVFLVWLGGCILGAQVNRKLLLLWGVPGAGKSTLLTLLARMLGDYGRSTSPRILLTGGNGEDFGDFTASSALAQLDGSRLAVVDDMPEHRGRTLRWNTGKFLSMTGGGTVEGRDIGKDTVQVGGFSIAAATNRMPELAADPSQAAAQIERLLVVRCPHRLEDAGLRHWMQGSGEAADQLLTLAIGRCGEAVRVGDRFPLNTSTWEALVESVALPSGRSEI